MFSHLSFFFPSISLYKWGFPATVDDTGGFSQIDLLVGYFLQPTAGYSSTIGALRSERWDLALHFLYEAQAAMSFQRKEGDLPSGK